MEVVLSRYSYGSIICIRSVGIISASPGLDVRSKMLALASGSAPRYLDDKIADSFSFGHCLWLKKYPPFKYV